MTQVGVRDLKTHASKILEEVEKQRSRYVITKRGRPVGVLLPVEEAAAKEASSSSAWKELERLGEQISRNWTSEKTTLEILDEIRR